MKSGNKKKTVEVEAKKRAILVSIWNPDVELYFDELEELLANIGIECIGRVVQKIERADKKTYLGPGKIEELKFLADSEGVDFVVFDDELTSLQRRILKNEMGFSLLDRTEVILRIFAINAGSNEAKLQVELAALKYSIPEIGEMTKGASRAGGGIGAKGSGEKEGEYKRRNIIGRIRRIEQEIESIKNRITQQKQGRDKRRAKIVSLVGYTNAGKSTLMNILTGAGVLEENRVFSTLDTKLKRMYSITNKEVLVSDTVGFIRKLPHVLVASFKSTLDTVKYSDLILHVVDVSKETFKQDIEVTESILDEIGAAAPKKIYVFNKIDICNSLENIHIEIDAKYENAIFISAAKKINITDLIEKIEALLE